MCVRACVCVCVFMCGRKCGGSKDKFRSAWHKRAIWFTAQQHNINITGWRYGNRRQRSLHWIPLVSSISVYFVSQFIPYINDYSENWCKLIFSVVYIAEYSTVLTYLAKKMKEGEGGNSRSRRWRWTGILEHVYSSERQKETGRKRIFTMKKKH